MFLQMSCVCARIKTKQMFYFGRGSDTLEYQIVGKESLMDKLHVLTDAAKYFATLLALVMVLQIIIPVYLICN